MHKKQAFSQTLNQQNFVLKQNNVNFSRCKNFPKPQALFNNTISNDENIKQKREKSVENINKKPRKPLQQVNIPKNNSKNQNLQETLENLKKPLKLTTLQQENKFNSNNNKLDSNQKINCNQEQPTPPLRYSHFSNYFSKKQQTHRNNSKLARQQLNNNITDQQNQVFENNFYSIPVQFDETDQSNYNQTDIQPISENYILQQQDNEQTQMQEELQPQDTQPDIKFIRNLPHDVYAQRMLEMSVISNQNQNEVESQFFLEKHEITSQMRAKMIDWMIEVMNSYKCSDQTLFLSINIMDKYFQKQQRKQQVGELHLIGVTSMFLACKYEEIYPIKLEILQEKIAHGKLSKEDIKQKEIDILEALDYTFTGLTLLDTLQLIMHEVDVSMYFDEDTKVFWQQICVYMAKMAEYDYELMSKFSYRVISATCIYVAFKILEQIYGDFKLITIVNQLRELLYIDNKTLIQSSTHLLYLARNFQTLYQSLSNLKKFNSTIFQELQVREQEYKSQQEQLLKDENCQNNTNLTNQQLNSKNQQIESVDMQIE